MRAVKSFLLGVMNTGSVHYADLSRYLSSITPKAAIRRVERFFQGEQLEFSDFALSIVEFLGFKGKFDLCLDRTNWKHGSKEVNYLVLSWSLSRCVSIPLFAVELNKAGSSNTKERIDLLEQFAAVFGSDRIRSLTADPEFVGETWLKRLIAEKIPFFIRVKENSLVPYGDDSIHVKDLFKHLASGESRLEYPGNEHLDVHYGHCLNKE